MKLLQILLSSIIILTFCFTKDIYAQNYYFKHIGAEDGLSSNIVKNINKDSRGYLWICCENALNRYDGAKFKKFTHIPGDSTSIASGGISSTLEDYDGSFWITTKNGVSIFDYKTEKFNKVFEIQGDSSFVKNLYLTKRNELFLVVTSGIYIYNREMKKFEKFFQSRVDQNASVITEDNFGNLYLGTWGQGIIVISSDRKRHFLKGIASITDLKSANSIETMVVDDKEKLWIGTRNGFFKANISKNINELNFQINPVLNKDGNPLQISFNMIHSLVIDESNKIWIGTENGLNIYDPETQKLQIQYSSKNSPGGLSNNLILDIYNDPASGMWISTYQGGISFYSKGNIPFTDKIPFITHAENKLIQYVKSVYQAPDRKLWVGTDYGLLRFSENFQLEKTYTYTGQPGSIPIGGVTSIFTDKFNNFWVGTWGGGVCRMDSISGKFIQYSKLDGANKTDSLFTGDCNIVAFEEDTKGNFWIVNKFKIVDRYDHKYKSFKQFDISSEIGRPNMEISSVDIDKNDNLWIGATGAGLIKFDTKTLESELFEPSVNENIEAQTNMPSTDVYSVHVHQSGKIWLGTGKGLSQFDPQTKKFINYSTENGLNSETVLGVISDNNDNIWLSTLNGISRFDTTGNFLNYKVDEGVISNAEVAYKGYDGTLFFGGVNGITVFDPDSIWRNELAPPIVFTDFKLFDKSILFNNKILPFHINEVNEIVLDYSQNNITIDFRALNFIQENKNVYTCKLEGFDKDWNYLGSTNEAKYSNLNPGTYYFKVKAANNSGVWNNSERILKISIRTPWWKTFIFRISAIILIVGLVFLVIRLRTIQLISQKKELERKVQERTREIEKQQVELQKQAEKLIETNTLLVSNQNEIERQKESIIRKKNLLEEKNEILEQQKEQILVQKMQTENMAAQLHEADQKKIKFMTNVSHEFRTPLTLIYSPLVKTLREFENIDKEKLFSRLELMHRNTRRLLRLINEFLDISKIEAGLVKMHLGNGSLTNFVQGIIDSYKFMSIQNNIDFTFISEPEQIYCLFDSDKVEKIVTNLLSNAFKFTPAKGRIFVELKVHQRNESDEIEMFSIKVNDTGIGIKDEFKRKIFDRFFQIENNEEQSSGTGIGLALTNELIAIYGGSIELVSEPDKGSLFTVTLPCHAKYFDSNAISADAIPSNYQHSNEMNFSNELIINESDEDEEMHLNNKKSTVLLVEDSEEIVHFLQEHFEDDYNFVFANDGIAGFDKAISLLPQAIILDVMMPKMNGFQLCEKLKMDVRTCHIPVIFLTALAEINEQMEGLENGADDYITKPFDVDLLKMKVNNLIDTRKKLKLLYQKKLTFETAGLVPESADEKLIRNILKIIEKEISNSGFGVEELSKAVGLSRTHLYRKVLDITDQRPVEFIRNLRLKKAAKLLQENKFYISEVAYMTGFNEMSYFRKIFKDFYGVSPSDFIKGIVTHTEDDEKN